MSVQTRLEQARYAIGRGVTQRRACTLLEVARSGLVYQCKMPKKDAPIVEAMRGYSALYPRFGARRVRVFLRRDGIVLGRDRTARIWAAAGLQCRPRNPRSAIAVKIASLSWRRHPTRSGHMTLSSMAVPMARA